MIRNLTLIAASFLALSACKTTPDTGGGNAVDNRAAFEAIQTSLNDASSTGYDTYLTTLRTKSADLIALSQLGAKVKTDGATDLDRRNLVVAISASTLLSDLPNASPEINSAVRSSVLNESKLKDICNGIQNADCAVGEVYIETLASRNAATHTLSLTSRDDLEGELVKGSFAAFENSVPSSSSDEASDTDSVRTSLIFQQACSVSWAQSLMLSKLPPADIPDVNKSFADAMASAFPETGVTLCADGSNACDAFTICEAGEPSCNKRKAAALINACGPRPSGLAEAINPASASAES